jgi:DNA repair protein RadC
MAFLEQEHLRLILLNTRNQVIDTPEVYKGSVNTAVVNVGELFVRRSARTARPSSSSTTTLRRSRSPTPTSP